MNSYPCFRSVGGGAWRWAAGAALLAVTCSVVRADADEEAAAPAPQRVRVQNGAAVVKLKPEEIKRAGLETAPLATTTRRLGQPALATVLDLQPLFEAAAAFSAAQADLVKATAELTASRAGYERAKKLNAEGQNVSTKELEATEAAWRSGEAAQRSARAALQARRAALRQQWGPVLPVWIEDGAPEYQRLLQGEMRLLRVTQPGAHPRATAPAEVSVLRPDGKWQGGSLVSPTGQVAPEFQTEGFYFAVNSGGGLLPGLNLSATLPAETGETKAGVVIPAAAVVWWQGRGWIYRETGSGVFTRTEITTDQPEGQAGYFVTGFPADHPVVTRGAQVLLSEENKPAGAED